MAKKKKETETSPYLHFYWLGIHEACVYFHEELGVDDALETDLAKWAVEQLEKAGVLKDEQT
jgi:hypothetical protein